MAKIAIGDGTIGSGEVFEELPTVSTFYLHFDNFLTCCFLKLITIETIPQIIGYDIEVFDYFKEQYVDTFTTENYPNMFADTTCANTT